MPQSLLVTVTIGISALAFVLEKKTKWGKQISGVVIGMFTMILLANLHIVPEKSEVYDFVYSWIVPIAIPMFLFKANLVSIFKETGKVLIAFILGGIGTIIGAITMFFILGGTKELIKPLGLFTATYVGGTINFVAISELLKIEGDTLAAAVAADNVVMAFLIIGLFFIAVNNFFRKFFKFDDKDYLEEIEIEDNGAIYPLDIVYTISIATVIATFSMFISSYLKGIPHILISTAITVALATSFPSFFGKIKGSEEIGIFFMYMFFTVVGASANIHTIIQKGLYLFVFAGGTILIHLIFILTTGYFFKIPLPEILIASNANIGGPTTACGMAMAKKWEKLVVPSVLVGLFGYVIATLLAYNIVQIVAYFVK